MATVARQARRAERVPKHVKDACCRACEAIHDMKLAAVGDVEHAATVGKPHGPFSDVGQRIIGLRYEVVDQYASSIVPVLTSQPAAVLWTTNWVRIWRPETAQGESPSGERSPRARQ